MSKAEYVAASPQEVCPLLNGMRIPRLTLNTAEGQPLDLATVAGERPAVVVFYRGGW
ncbi:MAG: hypothetical protein ACM3SW_18815 [Actinomycetota bacterium]